MDDPHLGSSMDLRQLRYFVETVRTGAISAAARKCKVAQPSLSQQISALESEIGEPLLSRHPRGVEPTAAGELLLHHAERLLEEETKLLEQFRARGEIKSGKILFGIIPTLAPYLIPLLLTDFRRQYPSIEIEVQEALTKQLIKNVVDGTIEFAILSDITAQDKRQHSLQVKELFSEPLMLALPLQHHLAKQENAPKPSDLLAEEIIQLKDGHCLREQTLRVCRFPDSPSKLSCDQLETAISMVESNLGIAIVPKLAIRKRQDSGVIFRNFEKPIPKRRIFLMKRKGTKLSKPAEKLILTLTNETSLSD